METLDRTPIASGCEVCVFEAGASSPNAAVATLLELPARYRCVLAADDEALRRVTPAGWSAIEYAAHTAEVLHFTSKRLILVFEQIDKELSPPHLEAVSASARTANPASILASLSSASDDLARVVDAAPPGAWEFTARRNGTYVTARELLGDALHEAEHHLMDARLAAGLAQEPVAAQLS